jgi:hypothetical protein
MVSKKLTGARKLHCLGVLFLAVTLSSSAERLQAAAVSKEGLLCQDFGQKKANTFQNNC